MYVICSGRLSCKIILMDFFNLYRPMDFLIDPMYRLPYILIFVILATELFNAIDMVERTLSSAIAHNIYAKLSYKLCKGTNDMLICCNNYQSFLSTHLLPQLLYHLWWFCSLESGIFLYWHVSRLLISSLAIALALSAHCCGKTT